MAVTGKVFGSFFKQALNKEHQWLAAGGDSFKCMLTTVTYTPDQDVHDYKDDVSNEIAASGGYSAGGQALGNKAITYTAGTNKLMLDCDDPLWTTSTITARTAVFYNDSPATANAKGLICYQQSDADIVSTGGDFRVQINAAGLVELTVA